MTGRDYWYPTANTFKEGELLEVTYGSDDWVGFWEAQVGQKNAVSGYLPEDIDSETGFPIDRKRKPVEVGTIVMYLGTLQETRANVSLVRVLYHQQIIAVMWECLTRAKV